VQRPAILSDERGNEAEPERERREDVRHGTHRRVPERDALGGAGGRIRGNHPEHQALLRPGATEEP